MPSFSSLFTDLTSAGFFYEKSSHHATYNFNQQSTALYRNQPRFPFEYYINVRLNKVGTASDYINQFFNPASWQQIAPLVKTVEMPSFKIETTPLNQYNRKRLSQTKVAFEPVKIVFHDVCDGKTLKFWEMYYRYYFSDGIEPNMNAPVQSQARNGTYSVESFLQNITPAINPNLAGLPASITNLFQSNAVNGNNSPTDTIGSKQDTENIVSDILTNHNFGFNLPQVANIRNLIQGIDIFQVHAGRFNQVTLVNPRISAFTHDTLNYAAGDKTLELTFTFDYEYAYYVIQNMQLGNPSNQSNNVSTIDQYEHGEFLELPVLAFNATLMDFIESNNPLLQSSNPILQRIGLNSQTALSNVTGAFASDQVVRRVSASALDGLAHISPTPYYPQQSPSILTRPFASTAGAGTTSYLDVNRIGGSILGG
jgi:hypothetical protein